ncbi:AAA family ATPase [Streptomyces sp. NBC_00271]|uniref:AAA family ATPase n=1 Tax=Streptomyces sp. NBC_00271 TaxID=2975697 RepID=UPI002E293035|nr:AAA family ATPase [Streptomyces sp. NBC_00271]
MTDIPVPHGPRWAQIAGTTDFPEREILRIKTFLNGVNSDDLVYVEWYSTIAGGFDEGEVIDRLVLVGEDGAGRALRRRDFSVNSKQLLDDTPAVYLCAVEDVEERKELRYVFIDCKKDNDKPTLVCRRNEFPAVFSALKMAGQGTGNVWTGTRLEDPDQWLELNESDYLFVDGLISDVIDNTAHFLKGDLASLFVDWGIPPKRGVLLHGDPGNGKTILTRLAAKRAIQAGTNVVFLNVGTLWEEAVGEQLRLAATRSPVLIILDDLDVHCGHRVGTSEVHDTTAQRQRFLADLLEFLDGVEPTEGYVLLASANRIHELDPALLRPGRLGVHIKVTGPPKEHRRALLQQTIAGLVKAQVPELSKAVESLQGHSYAEVAELARRYKIALIAKHHAITADQGLFDDVVEHFAKELEDYGGHVAHP